MIFRRSPEREQGFALVEALASLVVVGMVGLMLAAGATTGRRVWDRVDVRQSVGESLESAQSLLRDRIEQAFLETRYEGNPPSVAFSGDGEKLFFIASPPEVGRPAPLRRYGLTLDVNGDLILNSVSDVVSSDAAPVERQVLISRVRSMDIAYFGVRYPDIQPRWQRQWRDQPILPQVIRVRVVFEPGDPRQWPDLMVHPRATIDSSCLLNTFTHRCKGRA